MTMNLALLDWIFYGRKPDKKVFAGMLFCIAGAVLVNWTSAGRTEGFFRGTIFAFLAAFFWGCEGVLSGSGGQEADAGSAANIREIFSGLIDLLVIIPLLGGVPLLMEVLEAGRPVICLGFSGLGAAISYLCWYKSNSLLGCASGMSLNITYVFWGVLFCVLLFGQPISIYIVVGSLMIIMGSVLVAK